MSNLETLITAFRTFNREDFKKPEDGKTTKEQFKQMDLAMKEILKFMEIPLQNPNSSKIDIDISKLDIEKIEIDTDIIIKEIKTNQPDIYYLINFVEGARSVLTRLKREHNIFKALDAMMSSISNVEIEDEDGDTSIK